MDAEITIVIPVYNRAHIVGRTLESVAHQTLRPLDVILVDNNSSDNSYEVLQAWKQANEAPDFRVTVLSETKQGACAARNRGLAEVTTPYVMFFVSVDVMLPCHAESFVDAFRQDRTLDIVGRNITISFLNGAKSTKKFRGTLYHHIFHSLMQKGLRQLQSAPGSRYRYVHTVFQGGLRPHARFPMALF